MNGLRKRKKLKVFNFLRLCKPFIYRLNLRPYARKIYATVEINL